MINEADLMQKMEMFIHMNHRARAMHGGCGRSGFLILMSRSAAS